VALDAILREAYRARNAAAAAMEGLQRDTHPSLLKTASLHAGETSGGAKPVSVGGVDESRGTRLRGLKLRMRSD
jgi:hypothetical protein